MHAINTRSGFAELEADWNRIWEQNSNGDIFQHFAWHRAFIDAFEIVEDERSHLYFHCDFLRSQTRKKWQKSVFVLVWRLVMVAAAVVVAIDHRKAIRDLDIGLKGVCSRWKSYSKLAEVLVVAERNESDRLTRAGELPDRKGHLVGT